MDSTAQLVEEELLARARELGKASKVTQQTMNSYFALPLADPWMQIVVPEVQFKRQVYTAHVRNVEDRGFVHGVPERDLVEVEGAQMHRVMAPMARKLLADLRAARSRAKAKEAVRLQSTYRSADTQFKDWNDAFTRHWNAMRGEAPSP